MNRRTLLGGLFAGLIPFSFKQKQHTLNLKEALDVAKLPKYQVGDIVTSKSIVTNGQIVGVFHSSSKHGQKYINAYKTTFPTWNGGYMYSVFYYQGTEYTTLEKFAEHSKLSGNELLEAYNKLERKECYTHLEEDLTLVS